LATTDLRLTHGAHHGNNLAMARRRPPKPGKKALRACHAFVAKLDEVLARRPEPEARLLADSGIPANALGRWRAGRVIRLDDAWALAKRLGVSLDLLADDGRQIVVDQQVRAVEGPPPIEVRAIAHRADDPPAKSDPPKRRVDRKDPARRRAKR
jgi:hypothetical protein